MEIYFDDVLINEDYYTSLSTSFELFDSTFKLGATASNTFNLSIDKSAVNKQPNNVTIYQNGTLVATLIVDNIEETDIEYKYTLTDKMVNLEFNYDASEIFEDGSTTLLNIALDICSKAGIELGTPYFRSYDKKITWYDNTLTAREYIGYIAELNGGYAQIGSDGKLYLLKQKNDSIATISFEECSDFSIGERREITRVIYEFDSLHYEFGQDTGNTLYLDSNNVFITEESEVEAIYDDIKGFEFYNLKTDNCPINFNIKAGQIVTFSDGINLYPTIVGYELSFYGNWYGGYELNIESKKQEETQVIGTEEKIKSLKTIVNRNENTITQIAEKTTQIETGVNNNSTTINNNYQDIIQQLGDYAKEAEVVIVKEFVQSIQNESSLAIEIVKELQTDGVTRLDTKTGFTFGEDGLNIEKTDAKVKAKLDEAGLEIKDATGATDESLLFAGHNEKSGETIVESKNMKVEKNFVIGKYSRMEDFTDENKNNGTGVFWIGG